MTEYRRGDYSLRMATLADADAVIALRRLMFEEMGRGDVDDLRRMETAMRAYVECALPAGNFRAWVVEDAAGTVASCGATVVHESPPTVHNLSGREAYVMNVCTFPAHRRRGLARWIMETILEWARGEGIVSVTLRASDQGRLLYQSMGFQATNEMRLRLNPAPG